MHLISKVLSLESRLIEFGESRHKAFQKALRELSYIPYSWRIVRLMLQISPWRTLVVILGRFVEGIIPSFELHIKGEFLELVRIQYRKTLSHIGPSFA